MPGSRSKAPPLVPYKIPFLGHAIDFGQKPIELLYNSYKKVCIICSISSNLILISFFA